MSYSTNSIFHLALKPEKENKVKTLKVLSEGRSPKVCCVEVSLMHLIDSRLTKHT